MLTTDATSSPEHGAGMGIEVLWQDLRYGLRQLRRSPGFAAVAILTLAPGVRSTSEVFMHIALANFYLLSVTGPKMPADMTSNSLEKSVTAKPEVISWLKRSLEAVKNAHAGVTATDLQRRVKIEGRDARWMACISASLFTPTSTWASWWPTRA